MIFPIVGSSPDCQQLPAARAPGAGFQVALVYPPFGPAGLPSLGLALLSAGVKRLGIGCRTFYWNLEFAAQMPGASLSDKVASYFHLTGRNWMPFSEWTFAQLVHDDAMEHREADVRRKLQQHCLDATRMLKSLAKFESHILTLRGRAAELVDEMASRLEPYSLIGINTTFYQNLPALALARAVKTRWPQRTVVLGGANCDGEMGETLLRNFPFIDYVFVGESDFAFPEFALRISRGEPVQDIPGCVGRGAGGAIVSGPPSQPLTAMDDLPLPDFDDFVTTRQSVGFDRLYEVVLALESSRGCWWGARQHCTFCGLNANGMGYRQKSIERLRSEVEAVVDRYDAKFVFMADNILPAAYYEKLESWPQTQTDFFFEIKANVERRHVERLAKARITAVQPGIESFSSKILALMRKGTTGIQNIALLKFAREYGIYVAYNILVGFPGEDESEYDRMAAEIPKLTHLRPPSGMPQVEFHRFSPYHQAPEKFGIRLRPSPLYGDLYPLPDAEIARLAYLFEREDGEERNCSYAGALSLAIARWQKAYKEDDCTLTWAREGSCIIINDRRDERSHRTFKLAAFAAAVFQMADAPKGLKTLVREAGQRTEEDDVRNFLLTLFETAEPAPGETLLRFTREEFVACPQQCLQPFVDAGLFHSEDGRYLALPVASDYRPMTARWLEIGV